MRGTVLRCYAHALCVLEGDVLSLGLKSKKLVAEAMAVVFVALFQKVRVGVYVGASVRGSAVTSL